MYRLCNHSGGGRGIDRAGSRGGLRAVDVCKLEECGAGGGPADLALRISHHFADHAGTEINGPSGAFIADHIPECAGGGDLDHPAHPGEGSAGGDNRGPLARQDPGGAVPAVEVRGFCVGSQDGQGQGAAQKSIRFGAGMQVENQGVRNRIVQVERLPRGRGDGGEKRIRAVFVPCRNCPGFPGVGGACDGRHGGGPVQAYRRSGVATTQEIRREIGRAEAEPGVSVALVVDPGKRPPGCGCCCSEGMPPLQEAGGPGGPGVVGEGHRIQESRPGARAGRRIGDLSIPEGGHAGGDAGQDLHLPGNGGRADGGA